MDHFKGKTLKICRLIESDAFNVFWQRIVSLGEAPGLRRQSHTETTFSNRKSKEKDDRTPH